MHHGSVHLNWTELLPAQRAGRSPCWVRDIAVRSTSIGLRMPIGLFTLPTSRLVLVIWPLSIQLNIPVPRVAHTHEAPGFEGESEPPLLPAPPQKSGRDQLRIGDPPARQGLLLKPATTNQQNNTAAWSARRIPPHLSNATNTVSLAIDHKSSSPSTSAPFRLYSFIHAYRVNAPLECKILTSNQLERIARVLMQPRARRSPS